jgi:hypothetical protein
MPLFSLDLNNVPFPTGVVGVRLSSLKRLFTIAENILNNQIYSTLEATPVLLKQAVEVGCKLTGLPNRYATLLAELNLPVFSRSSSKQYEIDWVADDMTDSILLFGRWVNPITGNVFFSPHVKTKSPVFFNLFCFLKICGSCCTEEEMVVAFEDYKLGILSIKELFQKLLMGKGTETERFDRILSCTDTSYTSRTFAALDVKGTSVITPPILGVSDSEIYLNKFIAMIANIFTLPLKSYDKFSGADLKSILTVNSKTFLSIFDEEKLDFIRGFLMSPTFANTEVGKDIYNLSNKIIADPSNTDDMPELEELLYFTSGVGITYGLDELFTVPVTDDRNATALLLNIVNLFSGAGIEAPLIAAMGKGKTLLSVLTDSAIQEYLPEGFIQKISDRKNKSIFNCPVVLDKTMMSLLSYAEGGLGNIAFDRKIAGIRISPIATQSRLLQKILVRLGAN